MITPGVLVRRAAWLDEEPVTPLVIWSHPWNYSSSVPQERTLVSIIVQGAFITLAVSDHRNASYYDEVMLMGVHGKIGWVLTAIDTKPTLEMVP